MKSVLTWKGDGSMPQITKQAGSSPKNQKVRSAREPISSLVSVIIALLPPAQARELGVKQHTSGSRDATSQSPVIFIISLWRRDTIATTRP